MKAVYTQNIIIQRIRDQDYYLNESSKEQNRVTSINYQDTQDFVDISYSKEELLRIAAWENDTEALEALIEKGADIRTEDDAALRTLAHNGNIKIVDLLISKGADPRKLIGTTSYNNYQSMKSYLDQKIEELNRK